MEDAGQDAVSSPSTPGTGKSKLDTLPKEELIKFAKKQVIILQKVKSRCTELEKEVEKLKSKPSAGGTEDVIQALTDRLDAVLLEKAEAQQQLVSLKKENGKLKQEAKDAIEKTVELQEQLEQSSKNFFKEIESLKHELEALTFKHKEDACSMQLLLQESAEKQLVLTDQLADQSNKEDVIKTLQEELQQLRPTYEEQVLHLNKQLEAIAQEKNQEKKQLEESQQSALECHQREVHNLKEELLKLKSAHQEDVSDLVHQLETHGKEYEESRQKISQCMQDMAEQYLAKEKCLQEQLQENKVKYEQELILLRGGLDENKENFKGNAEGQESTSLESTKHFDSVLQEYESQHSILKDELTYTHNVKLKLEMAVKHLKDEFFHEREELEFKINELQLAKEEYSCVIEKLRTQLQGTNDRCEVMVNRHSEEVQVLREQHKKDILDLKETLMTSSEQEKSSLVFEVSVLKEQCERLSQEKEEAMSNYESLRETLVTLQDELGESAGKISREFKAMKQQQATDVQELQQKLRTAYNEKDVVLETVNRLKVEVEGLSSKQDEYVELRQKLSNLQESNGEMFASLQQKDAALKELEDKMNSHVSQNNDMLITLEGSSQELHKLQNMCEREQAHSLDLQQQIEALTKENSELKQQCEEWIEKIKEAQIENDQSYQKCAEFEKQIETFKQDKETHLSEVQALNDDVVRLTEEKHNVTRDMEQQFMSEREGCLVMKEQIENLQSKLQLANVEKEELGKLYEKDQHQKLFNEEKLSEVQALNDEVVRLTEEKHNVTRNMEQFMSEKEDCLVMKEQIENLLNKLQLVNVEKQELGKLYEKDKQEKLLNEEHLLAEVQALNDEVVRLTEEKHNVTRDMEQFMSEREGCLVIKEQIENLQKKLQLVNVEKEELGKLHEKEQNQKLLNEDKLLSEVQALHIEVERLHEENNMMTRDIERFIAEKESSLLVKEQVENLQSKLQLAVDEKEELSKLFEKDHQQKMLIESHLSSLLEQMGNRQLDENNENTMITILGAVEESIVRLKEENRGMVLQNDERCLLLKQDIERLQEENEVQCIELRSLIEDYKKEKVLLRAELEAALSEKEALQKDLLEMKTVNEKTRMENLDLLGRIDEVTKKLECNESLTKEQLEQPTEAAQENLEGLLEQKESDLCSLKAEFMFLKDSVDKSSAVESDQQSTITELQTKIVNLEKVSKEREERLNKIKAVAVKAKKELDSSRKEVLTIREELESVRSEKSQLSSALKDLIQGAESYKNLLVEYDKQAEQLDVAKERADYSERQIEELTMQLQAAYQQLDKMNSDKEDLIVRIDTLQTNTKLLESQILEMQRVKACVDKELEAEKLLKEQKIKDHAGALKQLEDIQAQLQKEKKQLQSTMQELELVRKDAQKSTLMDMEMADYDRLVKELNQKISEKDSSLEDLEQEVRLQKQREETLKEEITSLQASVEQYEERSTKMKQLLVKTKKELADSKQVETDQLLLQASLKGELEASQQQGESFKIQVAELTAEKHRIQEQLRTFTEQQQRSTNAYQQQIATLQDAYSVAKADQAAVTAEFEGYKVRVHNVLKQQKNKSSSHIENEAVRQEREHMEMMLEQLKTKLQDTQHNLQINATELQTLQADHDTLLERHNKMLQETVAKEAELREKLCTVQSENMVMKSEHAQILSQLTAQNEALRNNFRDQVRHMQEDHRMTIETLQQQLSKVEAQLFQQKSESIITSTSTSQQQMKTLRERRATEVPLLDMYIAAREEGEGMETTDTESVSSASTYIPPLDQLLNSPETKFEPLQWQPELSKEELVQKLNTTTKSIDHLSGLLHETEATNAILMEQITLLKNEVRRLERNQEREKSVNNLEYLKNVLLQFIFLKAGSERQRLLPVIDTMLHLSPEEKGKLVAIALGEEEAAARPAGWASYLHSWSALR